MQPLTKVEINGILSKSESLAHTTDLWQSGGQQLYMTVNSHIIDEVKKLKYFLQTYHIKDSYTIENLQREMNKVLSKWNLEEKFFFFVTDNVSYISHALCDLGGFN